MKEKSPLINILTYRLPFKLANQMHSEFVDRANESSYMINHFDSYKELIPHIDTIEVFIALSVFQKRVINNLDAATKFHDKVSNLGDVETISIGQYQLSGDEKNKLLGLVINYTSILKKYDLTREFLSFNETWELLQRATNLLKREEYGSEED